MDKPHGKKISFAGPWITQKELDYVNDAAKNGWYGTYDKHVKLLEKTVCDYLPRKHSLATHCCTNALHTSCAALGLKGGDEVICTDFSWVATAYAIVYTGAKPVFVDIEADSWCIDPAAIEKAITPETKAIMMVHTFGHPAQMDEIMEFARKHNLAIIEDAAPSLGSKFKGRRTGTFGDISCFSFQGGKIAVASEGGILATDNEELFKKAELFASMGRTDSKATFWSDFVGFQYTMGNLPAAMALGQVERIDELVANKRNIFSWYEKRLSDVEGIFLVKEKKDCFSNYTYPSILLKDSVKADRDGVVKALKEKNIHCRPAFPKMSLFPAHEARYPNPVCTNVSARGISLPAAHNLTEEDVEFVCDSLFGVAGLKKGRA